jgi:hypothetical protein
LPVMKSAAWESAKILRMGSASWPKRTTIRPKLPRPDHSEAATIFQFLIGVGFHLGAMRKSEPVCRYCVAPVKVDAVLCHCCGTAYPTSELRAALLSPFTMAGYVLAVLGFITFWFWQ